MTHAGPGKNTTHPIMLPHAAAYVAIAYAISWTVWLLGWWLAGRPDNLHAMPMLAFYIGSFGPTLAAVVLKAREGRGALRTWASGYLRWRIGWRALLAIALPLPLSALALTLALGYQPDLAGADGLPAAAFYLTLFPVIVLNGIATVFVGAGPLGEEGGWRGYFLPLLLPRLGVGRASVVVGVVWALWHLPIMLLFSDWRDGVSVAYFVPLYTLGVVGLSVLMTYVWLMSGRSLLACIWLHGVVNALASVAFNHKVWLSNWSQPASTLHFTLTLLMAAAVAAIAYARRGQPAKPRVQETGAAGTPAIVGEK